MQLLFNFFLNITHFNNLRTTAEILGMAEVNIKKVYFASKNFSCLFLYFLHQVCFTLFYSFFPLFAAYIFRNRLKINFLCSFYFFHSNFAALIFSCFFFSK